MTTLLDPSAPIFVAGHRGMVGSAVVRALKNRGFTRILTMPRSELDLRDAAAVRTYFEREKPTYVVLAAAKVGGILANSTYPADFIRDNLGIAQAVIGAAHDLGVKKLLNLGSSCIYPRLAPQPLREEYLLSGPLESTNRAYAVAKIAAIELCDSFRSQHGDDFISAMPTNLYGPGDNFDLLGSHVIPALIRKFDDAKRSGAASVTLWGTGTPMREFLHVDDLANACLYLLEHFSAPGPLNVGTGEDLTIKALAEMVREVVGSKAEIEWDSSKPDGTPRKLLDVSRLKSLGWLPKVELRDGLASTYEWYLEHRDSGARLDGRT
ncbi:MAG: GDP-L-fucose synthase [Polyangiaceae bacterium]